MIAMAIATGLIACGPRVNDRAQKVLCRRAMSERIHELLHRNLQEVFGEGDAARRRAAIQEL
jgi:hypothetical protein